MALKPEIQYIGQFYVHGSEAKAVEVKQDQEKKKQKSEYELPLHRFEKVQKISVDPLAICSIVLAAVLMVCMVAGTLQIQSAWEELDAANRYVYNLEAIHRQRVLEYRTSYDLEEVRAAAENMGLIPVAEAKTMELTVTIPEPEVKPTLWEDIVWFMEGLFA